MAAQDPWSKLRESPRDWRILRWLRRKPQPVKCVGETDDGEEITCAVSLGKGSAQAQWSDAVRVLHSCTKIRAFNKEGEIIRVLEHDPNDPELIAEEQREESSARGGRGHRGGISVPLISVDVPKLIDNVARNMKDVSAAAAQQQATAFSAGFAAMTSVVNLCLTILMRVDSRLEQAEASAAQLVEAQPTQSPRDALVMMALQKAMGGGGIPAQGVTLDPNTIAQIMAQFQQSQGPGPEANGHG